MERHFFCQIRWFYDDNRILISFIARLICSSWSFGHARILFSQFPMSVTFCWKYILHYPYRLKKTNWYIKEIQGYSNDSRGREKKKMIIWYNSIISKDTTSLTILDIRKKSLISLIFFSIFCFVTRGHQMTFWYPLVWKYIH
jgi:hypothetical protein